MAREVSKLIIIYIYVDNLHVRNERSFKEYMRRCADRNPSAAGELPVQKFCRELKAFEADTGGNVTILSGLALTLLMAFASLGAEYGAGLLLQTENQRIADSAAFIAATYCGANSECSTTTTLNTATAIAQNIGALNGIPGADVTSSVVTSPSGTSGAEALQIKVSTTKFLMITPIEGAPNFLSLTALSYGQIGATASASASACVVSLSATTGISLSGGVSLRAPNCGVATNNTLTVPCGTTLTAQTISYNTTAPTVGCSNMTPAAAVKAAVTDPLAGTSQVTTAEGRLSTVTAMTNPTAPTVTVSAASGGGRRGPPPSLTSAGLRRRQKQTQRRAAPPHGTAAPAFGRSPVAPPAHITSIRRSLMARASISCREALRPRSIISMSPSIRTTRHRASVPEPITSFRP